MIAVITLLLVITLSIIITRIATLALVHTGLSRETARFQARSAFTGSGFTTAESEMVVHHPVRRRIVLTLMLLGNAGIVTAISSLVLTFVRPQQGAWPLWLKVVLLTGGVTVLWLAALSRWMDRLLTRVVDRAIARYTALDVADYSSLLHLAGDYRLVELQIEGDDWICGKTLREARLRDEGINVVAVQRGDGTFLGNPRGATGVHASDRLIVYGRTAAIAELDRRKKGWNGDTEHGAAIAEQSDVLRHEREQDPKAQRPPGGGPGTP